LVPLKTSPETVGGKQRRYGKGVGGKWRVRGNTFWGPGHGYRGPTKGGFQCGKQSNPGRFGEKNSCYQVATKNGVKITPVCHLKRKEIGIGKKKQSNRKRGWVVGGGGTKKQIKTGGGGGVTGQSRGGVGLREIKIRQKISMEIGERGDGKSWPKGRKLELSGGSENKKNCYWEKKPEKKKRGKTFKGLRVGFTGGG